jgi:hypothetical protein
VVGAFNGAFNLAVPGKASGRGKDIEHEFARRRRQVEVFGEAFDRYTERIKLVGRIENIAGITA